MAIKRPRTDLVCDQCGKQWEDSEDITYVLNYSSAVAQFATLGDDMPGSWSAHLCSLPCVQKFANSDKAKPTKKVLPNPIKSNGRLDTSFNFE